MTAAHDDSASDSGMPNSTTDPAPDRARASARGRAGAGARASLTAVAAIGHLLARFPGAGRLARLIWADFADSWVRTGSTPTLASYLASEHAMGAPYGKPLLRRLRLVWAYTGGAGGTLLGHAVAHILQSPIRLTVTVAVLAALYLAPRLGGG